MLKRRKKELRAEKENKNDYKNKRKSISFQISSLRERWNCHLQLESTFPYCFFFYSVIIFDLIALYVSFYWTPFCNECRTREKKSSFLRWVCEWIRLMRKYYPQRERRHQWNPNFINNIHTSFAFPQTELPQTACTNDWFPFSLTSARFGRFQAKSKQNPNHPKFTKKKHNWIW